MQECSHTLLIIEHVMHGELAADDVKVHLTFDSLQLLMLQRLVYRLQGV